MHDWDAVPSLHLDRGDIVTGTAQYIHVYTVVSSCLEITYSIDSAIMVPLEQFVNRYSDVYLRMWYIKYIYLCLTRDNLSPAYRTSPANRARWSSLSDPTGASATLRVLGLCKGARVCQRGLTHNPRG